MVFPETDPDKVAKLIKFYKFLMDPNHPKIKYGKTGILIINLGTPNSTSWWDISVFERIFVRQKSYRSKPINLKIILNLFILTLGLQRLPRL